MNGSLWAPIDGETPIDLSDLKDRTIQNRASLNRAEADNIRAAHLKYLAGRLTKAKARFDYSWFLQLHRDMFCDVWTFAGCTRKEDLNLGVPWLEVEQRLMNLVLDLESWESKKIFSRQQQAVRLHYIAVAIHPFRNGNGRWSRMPANIWLRLGKEPIVQWPEETIGSTSVIRDEYLKAIRSADGGDYAPLTNLHSHYSG